VFILSCEAWDQCSRGGTPGGAPFGRERWRGLTIIFRGPELCQRLPVGEYGSPYDRGGGDRRARALSESRYRRVRHTKRSADVNQRVACLASPDRLITLEWRQLGGPAHTPSLRSPRFITPPRLPASRPRSAAQTRGWSAGPGPSGLRMHEACRWTAELHRHAQDGVCVAECALVRIGYDRGRANKHHACQDAPARISLTYLVATSIVVASAGVVFAIELGRRGKMAI